MHDATEANKVQVQIIRQLFANDGLRFSEINTLNLPSDQLSYHLRQLIKYGLISKTIDNRYSLTVNGRGKALMLDGDSDTYIEQGFVAARVYLSRKYHAKQQYLMQQRSVAPYKGRLSEPGGKILFGEDVALAAKRYFQAETGLTCDMTVHGLAHLKDRYDGRIVQDKFFFIVRAADPVGALLPKGRKGKHIWMTLQEIKVHPGVMPNVVDMLTIAESSGFGFMEATRDMDSY